MRLPRKTMLALAGATCLATAAPVHAQQILAPHRAVYDIVLDDASDRSGITGISGRMVYEFNGSACEGYTVNFRFVTQIDTAETSRVTDQQTTTFEDGEGKSFSFVTKSFVDQALDKEVRGEAMRDDDALRVEIQKPAPREVELERTQFPTQHLAELIDKARDGENFYETTLFDGAEDGDKVMTTTVVIGREETDVDASEAEKALGEGSSWPVSIAYFDLGSGDGEEVPDYRIDFKLHENGVTRDLLMDYGDFSMRGNLVDLAMLPEPKSCAE